MCITFFLDSTYHSTYDSGLSLSDLSLSVIISGSIHVDANGIISFRKQKILVL